MAYTEIGGVSIRGIACCLPDNKIETRSHYERFGQEKVDKFITKTGIESNYISTPNQCASDLAFEAADKLINELGWDRNSINGLLFFTQSPDYRKPSTACILQHRLDLPTNSVAFDVNLGCSSFVYGLWVCSQLMAGSDINRMLLLIGDNQTKYISPYDHSATMLMTDAGSVIAMEKTPNVEDVFRFQLMTDGSKFKSIYIPAGASRNKYTATEERTDKYGDGILKSDYDHHMNGLDVFEFTISKVPKTIKEYLKRVSLTEKDFDYLVLHQANKAIIEKIAHSVKFPLDKTPINIDRFGNSNGSSIPLLIVDKLQKREMNRKLRLLVCGYGIGLSWGVADIFLDKPLILPLIFSNFIAE